MLRALTGICLLGLHRSERLYEVAQKHEPRSRYNLRIAAIHHDNKTINFTARCANVIVCSGYNVTDDACIGRRFATTPIRTWTRTLASEVDAIEASLKNSLKETHSIEALVQNETSEYIAPIDDETHAPIDYDADSVAHNYHEMKRIRALST